MKPGGGKGERDEVRRMDQLLRFERVLRRRGLRYIAGVDEAGRGPLAGPVVAAAVVLSSTCRIPGIDDSKKLHAAQRERLYERIREQAVCTAVGSVSPEEIDQINILRAAHRAMIQAVDALDFPPEFVLIDGSPAPKLPLAGRAVVGGDRRCYSIAAASIVAKVTRDRMMQEYDALYPDYGFAEHKGYGTRKHVEALRKFGPCPIHRATFKVSGWL